ncbi:DUF2797 domain-containing protein [Halobacteriaceae archaeon GCM10025711]
MQIVGYEGTTPEHPGAGALYLAEDGTVRREVLDPGTDLAYTLGERHCAGATDGERHLPCDADGAPYCDVHASTWVCARCTGTCLKDEMDCYEEHAVYLAAFAPATFKVGVTRFWRLDTRLREQGADRAAHVHTVSNGRIAREIEADIAADVGDRVRVPDKVAGLHRSVDETAWESLLGEFDVVETFAFDYGFSLDARPVPETLATGTVRGAQGRVLVVDRGGSTYAVDLRDLVGYEVAPGRSERALQSSLGAFE